MMIKPSFILLLLTVVNYAQLSVKLNRQAKEFFSLLCWIEKTITTHQRNGTGENYHREYSIIMESSEKLHKDVCDDVKETTQDLKIRNSTKVKESGDLIITEKITVFCGMGPVLYEKHLDLPQKGKRTMEVKVGNGLPITWKMCDNIDTEIIGTTRSSTTYDTIATSKSPIVEQQTESYENTIPVETQTVTSTIIPKTDFDCNDTITGSVKKPIRTTHNVLLSRNIRFLTLNRLNIMKNPFDHSHLLAQLRKQKDPVLFNVLFPNENLFENQVELNEKRVFLIKIKITLGCQELINDHSVSHKARVSKMEIEEDNIVIMLPYN